MIGIDLVEPRDADELTGPLIRRRIFTAAELERASTAELLAAFAAKEALLKALGWGIERAVGRFGEIEAVRDERGGLRLRTSGLTRRELESRGVRPVVVPFEVRGSQGAAVLLVPDA